MEEHFNEIYMQSNKFPRCTFSGRVINVATLNLSKEGEYTVNVEGDLTIHGVTHKISTPGTIRVRQGKVSAITKFRILPGDYNISIPSVVADKFANDVEINVECLYEPR